jgi:hypothetical protein
LASSNNPALLPSRETGGSSWNKKLKKRLAVKLYQLNARNTLVASISGKRDAQQPGLEISKSKPRSNAGICESISNHDSTYHKKISRIVVKFSGVLCER